MSTSPPTALPCPASDAHKGTFGRVLLIGGSRGMAGSITLSSIAALHSGSGLVSTAVPDSILGTVAGFHPSLMTIALPCSDGKFALEAWRAIESQIEKQDAVGVGPGMTTGPGSIEIVRGLLQQRSVPVVFDADAINVIAKQDWFNNSFATRSPQEPDIVLTPHRGELARLTGVPADAPEKQDEAAHGLAISAGITIVIKGGPTRVVGAHVDMNYTNDTGNSGMATAGSGDVLTGIIASLLGQGLSGWDAARLGVWIHGIAGDQTARRKSRAGMTSLHLVETLAEVADQMFS
ncbi:NAD(P)H-hydrate dehydratase [Neorhodopirellula pilleata]|uniref:ADP-dependent (S)-NAD(P)H-hydrate dehydratase n=1 Tax=Neorhodopirellula pilleata TaxID=2714738 RepID=A0A5C5ZPU7_9BACT|nr:NAD(P)H-hydrate dehydratase [Neorhodopirellula pilleata]TWT89532.1 ATP-dependent (S)-NAD(P)H-hydrate dehydratase [Neorhodopirellula pilleata]